MKRFIAILVVAMLLVCSAFAEGIELSGYLGADLNTFAQAAKDTEVKAEYDYAANKAFSVYASANDDGLINYISLVEEDLGYTIYGISVAMTQDDVLAIINELKLDSMDGDDPGKVYYYNDDLTVWITVVYTEGVVEEVSCLAD